MSDTYLTIAAPSEGLYKEKMSKFLAFATPCRTVEAAMAVIAAYRKKYHDARHVCWAYRLGATGAVSRSCDDGEPSGTAGRPILSQMLSAGFSDIVIVVVRYFGGIKLGTGGLAVAYKTAAAEALRAAVVAERTVEAMLSVTFGYEATGEVMRVIKEEGCAVVRQDFGQSCLLELAIRQSLRPRLQARLAQISGVTVGDGLAAT